MKITLSNSESIEIVKKMDRLNQFGFEGWMLLIEHMEEVEMMETDDNGQPLNEIEFDPIAICCDFTRYENLKEFQDSYGDEYQSIEDIEEEAMVFQIETEFDSNEIKNNFGMVSTDAFIVSNF